jgi:hypothetical protein
MQVISSSYLPVVDTALLDSLYQKPDYEKLFEALVEPLHQELHRRQDFDFMEELSKGQQLILSFDYIRSQVKQGGFIQLIQNQYTSLILPVPDWLTKLQDEAMAQVLDDVLKVYVLNIDALDRETTIEEFAKLYEEFKEFEELETRFNEAYPGTMERIVNYAMSHLPDFVQMTPSA